MDSNVILKDRSAVVLLNEINDNPALKAQIEAYFTPYCDCDITEWIVARVLASDQAVIAKIRELIAARDLIPIVRGGTYPFEGQLLKAYCVGEDYVGIYADGVGGVVSKTIETASVNRGCKMPETLQYYRPYVSQQGLVDAGLDGVIFDDSPSPSPDENTFSGQKIFYSAPRTPRLQFKIGGLVAGDYENLSVRLLSGVNIDGIYTGYPDADILLNQGYGIDWNGNLTAVYNPNTRVVKLESYYSERPGGVAYLAFMRGNQIISWINLSTQWFDYDASTNLSTPFITFIGNPRTY